MRLLTLSLLGCSFLFFAACSPETEPTSPAEAEATGDDHDHAEEHSHAETFSEAMEELNEFQMTIDKAFTADTPDEAHDALHEVGHVLEQLPKLAEKEEVEEAKLEEIKAAVEELFESYGDLDGMMHGQGEADYADIAKKIEESMAKLKL